MRLAQVQDTIEAPAARIWAVLADFARPQRLARTIESCQADGDTPGAVRIVKARGLAIHERLVQADAATFTLRYEALACGDMPAPALSSYLATVVLYPMGPEQTLVQWTGEGEVQGDAAARQATATHFALYARAIENLNLETRAA